LAVQARTTVLANRAWTIVNSTRMRIAQDIARRRLLDHPARAAEEHERLALEDRRNWRESCLVQLEGALPADAYTREDWYPEVERIKSDFLRKWAETFEKEDARMTGFLRKRVLEQLVQELSQDLSGRLLTLLIQVACNNCERGGSQGGHSRALAPSSWAGQIRTRLGRDAGAYALFSVRFETLANRHPDVARAWLFGVGGKSGGMASEIQKELATANEHALKDCKLSASGASMPLALFGFLFEELRVTFGEAVDGIIQFKLAPESVTAVAARADTPSAGGFLP
jgi:hypothetical protein